MLRLSGNQPNGENDSAERAGEAQQDVQGHDGELATAQQVQALDAEGGKCREAAQQAGEQKQSHVR